MSISVSCNFFVKNNSIRNAYKKKKSPMVLVVNNTKPRFFTNSGTLEWATSHLCYKYVSTIIYY